MRLSFNKGFGLQWASAEFFSKIMGFQKGLIGSCKGLEGFLSGFTRYQAISFESNLIKLCSFMRVQSQSRWPFLQQSESGCDHDEFLGVRDPGSRAYGVNGQGLEIARFREFIARSQHLLGCTVSGSQAEGCKALRGFGVGSLFTVRALQMFTICLGPRLLCS